MEMGTEITANSQLSLAPLCFCVCWGGKLVDKPQTFFIKPPHSAATMPAQCIDTSNNVPGHSFGKHTLTPERCSFPELFLCGYFREQTNKCQLNERFIFLMAASAEG